MKPHIGKTKGQYWICVIPGEGDFGIIGYGISALEAYEDWSRMIRSRQLENAREKSFERYREAYKRMG